MDPELQWWFQLLAPFRKLFTQPGADRFIDLLTAWVVCPGRRTITRLWQMMESEDRPRYEAYAEFCRAGRWPKASLLCGLWAKLVVSRLPQKRPHGLHELWLLL